MYPEFDDFRKAIQGAQNIQASNSPFTGSTVDLGNIQKMFTPKFQAAASNAASSGLVGAAKIHGQEEEAQARAAREQKIQELQDTIKTKTDQLDPSKWEKRRKDDGGFDFYDGAGNQVDLNTYAQVTGKKAPDILKDSDNDLDRQMVQDYQTLQKVVNLYAKGGPDAQGKLTELAVENGEDPDFFKGKTAADLMKQFKSAYPNAYNSNVNGEGGAGQVRTDDQSVFSRQTADQIAEQQKKKKGGSNILGGIGGFIKSLTGWGG